MILHIRRIPEPVEDEDGNVVIFDNRPDIEIVDENDNLIATVYNQVEGDPSDPTEYIAQSFVEMFNRYPLSPDFISE